MKETKQEEKKVEVVADVKPQSEQPAWRKIVIETNGNDVRLTSAEIAGVLELTAILQKLILFINKEGK